MLPKRVIPFAEPRVKVSLEDALPQRLVVQIGRDRELLRLRAKLIHSSGYTVHSIFPEEATAEVRKTLGSRVWVFCHTLEFYELTLLAVAIRNSCPADRLLRLAGLNNMQQPQGLFDGWLDSVRGVDELLRAVDRMMKQPALSK
ncbi:MAG TPA: hypothetical protein VN828_17840 [Acidobacteriaceae bacterium]|nr:hypothetical protein [Acidobacteriaceae bacterium]